MQRFAPRDDLDAADCTIEERAEYEPYLQAAMAVFAGVDYAAILSTAMMLRHLGEEAAAAAVEKATLQVLADGETLTPDLGGNASTSQVGDAVVNALGQG